MNKCKNEAQTLFERWSFPLKILLVKVKTSAETDDYIHISYGNT